MNKHQEKIPNCTFKCENCLELFSNNNKLKKHKCIIPLDFKDEDVEIIKKNNELEENNVLNEDEENKILSELYKESLNNIDIASNGLEIGDLLLNRKQRALFEIIIFDSNNNLTLQDTNDRHNIVYKTCKEILDDNLDDKTFHEIPEDFKQKSLPMSKFQLIKLYVNQDSLCMVKLSDKIIICKITNIKLHKSFKTISRDELLKLKEPDYIVNIDIYDTKNNFVKSAELVINNLHIFIPFNLDLTKFIKLAKILITK